MQVVFYTAGAVAVVASAGVITALNPVHALLNLVVSLLASAMIFVKLGAPFAAMLEIIVYAGAIMVVFIFVVMILNLGEKVEEQERQWLRPSAWLLPGSLSAVLLAAFIVTLASNGRHAMEYQEIAPKQVGVALFGTYLLLVELVAMVLLGAMVIVWHLGRDHRSDDY
jgi:NADH-quinone oxidoreductase subunit J